MTSLIKEIFELQIESSPRMKRADKKICDVVEEELLFLRNRFSEQEYEEFRDAVFHITYRAEQEAFAVGFSTALQLFAEGVSVE